MAQKKITSDQILSIEGTQIQNNELYGEVCILNEPGSPIPAMPRLSFKNNGGEIWFENSVGVNGGSRITRNDGGGNWNFRGNNYIDAGVKYLADGNGATHLQITDQEVNGKFDFKVSDGTGVSEGDTVSWDNIVSITPTVTSSTQPFSAPVGSAAAPGFTFTGDTDTGLFRDTTNSISISAAGATKAHINGTGLIMDSFLRIEDGTAGAPQLAFNGDTNTGIYLFASDSLAVSTGGARRFTVGNSGVAVSGNCLPTNDNMWDVGGSINRWDDIYATNGTIQTSDLKDKMDIAPTPLGLDFINALNPIEFRWKICHDIDGGSPEITERIGFRKHHGLIAQEIKQVMDDQDIASEDFAGYIVTGEGSPQMFGLRYDQFTGPIIKSIQELNDRANFYNEEVITSTSTLNDIKTNAKALVDQTSEHIRCKYITPGFGQSLAYQEKSEEAADFVASGYPTGSPIDLSDYPFIQAEVNATGKTPQDAADDILAQKALWISKGASIEEVRLGGKKAIDDAPDEGDIITAKNAAISALEEI